MRRVVNRYPLRSRAAFVAVTVLTIVVVILGLDFVQKRQTPPLHRFDSARVSEEMSAPQSARRLLERPEIHWAKLDVDGNAALVSFAAPLSCWPALKAIRYGLDTETPDREFPIPPSEGRAWPPQDLDSKHKIWTAVPASTKYVSVQLTFFDGSTSEVRTYHIGDAP